jgi:hypothetical protein
MEQNMSDAQEGCGPGAAGEDSYETLAGAGQAAIKVQRSRFLATAAPASSLTVARRLVAELTGQHHDAHHVCFAWRGGHGSGLREVRHDAGEPSGTAGEPILGALRSAGLSDAVVIVVRHFGGVKLGTGGLGSAAHGMSGRRVGAGLSLRLAEDTDASALPPRRSDPRREIRGGSALACLAAPSGDRGVQAGGPGRHRRCGTDKGSGREAGALNAERSC